MSKLLEPFDIPWLSSLYLEKGKTIIGQYYASSLDHFNAKLKEKLPLLSKKKVDFHHDNAQAHLCAVAAAKWVGLIGIVFSSTLHSWNDPQWRFSFPKLKKKILVEKFSSNSQIMSAWNEEFAKSYFLEELKKIKQCIIREGDYVGEYNAFWYVQ